MFAKVLLAFGAILVMLVAWISVQQMTRRFALRHPEFGPPREEVGGCGGACKCKGGESCQRE